MAYDTAIAIGLSVIIAMFYYIAASMRSEKHGAMQILFLFMGQFFTLDLLDLLQKMANIAGEADIESVLAFMYNSFIYIIVVTMFYFIVMFIMDVYRVHKENIKKSDSGGMR